MTLYILDIIHRKIQTHTIHISSVTVVGSSDRKMNLETETPVMTHCKEPALTSKMTLTFFESVNGLILY